MVLANASQLDKNASIPEQKIINSPFAIIEAGNSSIIENPDLKTKQEKQAQIKKLHEPENIVTIGLDALSSSALTYGPCSWVINLIKNISDKLLIRDSQSDQAKETIQIASGLVGVFGAERTIGKLDPYMDRIVHKFSNYISEKNPKLFHRINEQVENFINSSTKKILSSLFKINPDSKANLSENLKEEMKTYKELKETKFSEYESSTEKLNNDSELQKQKFSLVKKLLAEKFQNAYGKSLPSSIEKGIESLLVLTKNNHYIRQIFLLVDEAALAIKPVFDRMGVLGTSLFTTLYNIVPNAYLGLRAAGMYLSRDLEKEAQSL
ncbi:MAG: hypothetical protein EBR67_02815 [Proteobacteria bacterium]|nr:hypothetical protein [Pseudomonadota bacterium]